MENLKEIQEALENIEKRNKIEKSLNFINKAITEGKVNDDILEKAKYISRKKVGDKWVYTYAETPSSKGGKKGESEEKRIEGYSDSEIEDKFLKIGKVLTNPKSDEKETYQGTKGFEKQLNETKKEYEALKNKPVETSGQYKGKRKFTYKENVKLTTLKNRIQKLEKDVVDSQWTKD